MLVAVVHTEKQPEAQAARVVAAQDETTTPQTEEQEPLTQGVVAVGLLIVALHILAAQAVPAS